MMRLRICTLAVAILCSFSLVWGQVGVDEIAPGRVILKLKADYRNFATNAALEVRRLKPVFEQLKVTSIRRKFPKAEQPSSRTFQSSLPDKRVDITLIYEIHYAAEMDPRKVAAIIRNTQTVEYAEPFYIPKPVAIPDDDRLDSLWHLPMVRAFEAWDIDTGSSDVTIAIVDTGCDIDHPDLVDAYEFNENEIPNNGIDDDENGYVDDYLGWNFLDSTGNVDEVGFSHGTHVAGIAGAVTNNGEGVAGTGWSCKILPVKSGDKLTLERGYEGVVYAADRGAEIINCSWGNFSRSAFAEDIIMYATYNKQATLIGAAGNDNRQNLFYPASYIDVLSVGASDEIDGKADFSNYNYTIDLVAPGTSIFSLKNDGYGFDSGTSMAAPIVAGAAALIKNRYPQLQPRQIMEQLRVKAQDSIYQLDTNQPYIGKLGKGRLDMYEALLQIDSPALRVENHEITDQDDMIFSLGEDIYVGVEIANYLLGVDDVEVHLESMNENITVVSEPWSISSLPQFGRANNLSAPFVVRMDEVTERNQEVVLKVVATSPHTSYRMEEFLTFSVNQDYVNIILDNIAASVSKDGLVGFTDFLQTDGLGFQWRSEGNILYEAGLMIGHVSKMGATRVVDRVRNGSFADQDFWQEAVIERTVPEGQEDFLALGSFTDTSAIRDEIGLLIDQEVKGYKDTGDLEFIFVNYTIHNTTDEVLEDVAVGMFADWDVVDANANHGITAYGKRMGYVHSTGNKEITAAIQAFGDWPFHSYMVDNVTGGAGGIDLYDEEGFTSEDKFITLTTDRLEAGFVNDDGNDVIQVVSLSEIDIPSKESITVSFAFHAGNRVEEVLAQADAVYKQYYGYLPGKNVIGAIEVGTLWPNPTQDNLQLTMDIATETEMVVDIFDTRGMRVHSEALSTLYPGFNQVDIHLPPLRSGVYFVRLQTSDYGKTIPFQYTAD